MDRLPVACDEIVKMKKERRSPQRLQRPRARGSFYNTSQMGDRVMTTYAEKQQALRDVVARINGMTEQLSKDKALIAEVLGRDASQFASWVDRADKDLAAARYEAFKRID
jgi:hypothetical protein